MSPRELFGDQFTEILQPPRRRKSRATVAMVKAARTIRKEIRSAVRAVGYRLFTMDLISATTKANTEKVSRADRGGSLSSPSLRAEPARRRIRRIFREFREFK